MARREWNVARNDPFGRQAKSAGFRSNPQQHAGIRAIGQEKPQTRTVGGSILVIPRSARVPRKIGVLTLSALQSTQRASSKFLWCSQYFIGQAHQISP
jgi:hypothetical protein